MPDPTNNSILVVCEYGSLNGGERSFLAVANHATLTGWKFVVAAPPKTALTRALRRSRIETIDFDCSNGEGGRLSQDEARAKLGRLIREWQPAIVHANSLAMSRLVGPLCDRADCPIVGHVRDIIRLSRKAVADVNECDHLVFVSRAARDWHASQLLNGKSSHVIYNGVNRTEFGPRKSTGFLHRELRIETDNSILLAVGQIGLRKGFDDLIAAMPAIVSGCPNTHLVIVGERFSEKRESIEFEQRLHKSASTGKMAGKVHFLGGRNDVNLLMNEASLLVHAAKQEPLGRVLIEAVASGLPIIATDVGGTREILEDPCFGQMLIQPNDPLQLSDLAVRLLRDSKMRDEMSRNLLAISSRFDINERARISLDSTRR